MKSIVVYRPLLGNDRETNVDTAAVAKQQPTLNTGSTVGSRVSYVTHSKAVSRD
jgi:hypothetical protein